jgi:hypothetical protein
MQKEVLVANSAQDCLWRLTSDEGGDLNGFDQAPFPLGHMSTGLAAAYATEILALAARRQVRLSSLRVRLDSRYTMEGSVLRGTMVGGAMPPEVRVEARSELDPAAFRSLVTDAVGVATASGLLRADAPGRFSLTVDGRRVEAGPSVPDVPVAPGPSLDALIPDARWNPGVGLLLDRAAPEEDETKPGEGGGGLNEVQSRVLVVRGSCAVREDGIKEVVQHLLAPAGGSAWRALSDEPLSSGRPGRAPDAASYLSAGLAFCFLTQLGRYATIVRGQLPAYEVVQDFELPLGGASGGTGQPGVAGPPVTHVFLTTPEGDDFARKVVQMGEQTCFLHALYRTPLRPRVLTRVLN